MSIDDPFIAPNYLGWATSPVLPIKTGLQLLARHAVDSSGWSSGEEFETKFKSEYEELSKVFCVAYRAGKVKATIQTFKDVHFGELVDYANSQIEKKVLLNWAKHEGREIPTDLETHSSKFQSTSDVANIRWAAKIQEEVAIETFVKKLVSSGCSCDNEQMKNIVFNAHDDSGKMLIELKNLSKAGVIKVIRKTFREHYDDEAYKKLKGSKGFQRTHNCKIHK